MPSEHQAMDNVDWAVLVALETENAKLREELSRAHAQLEAIRAAATISWEVFRP